MQKYLGKIQNVYFGLDQDYPFLFGLELTFKFDDGCFVTSTKDVVNIGETCKWTKEERCKGVTKCIDQIIKVMKDANVNEITKLKGKPVELTIEANTLQDYRILTEVI